jgi:hypothetical protein
LELVEGVLVFGAFEFNDLDVEGVLGAQGEQCREGRRVWVSGCEAVGEEARVASFGAHARDECGGIAAFGQRDGDPVAFVEREYLLASHCRVSLRDYTALPQVFFCCSFVFILSST